MPCQAAAGGGGYPRVVTYLQGKEYIKNMFNFPVAKMGKAISKIHFQKGYNYNLQLFNQWLDVGSGQVVVSTQLQKISQIGSFPQVGVKIKAFETTT